MFRGHVEIKVAARARPAVVKRISGKPSLAVKWFRSSLLPSLAMMNGIWSPADSIRRAAMLWTAEISFLLDVRSDRAPRTIAAATWAARRPRQLAYWEREFDSAAANLTAADVAADQMQGCARLRLASRRRRRRRRRGSEPLLTHGWPGSIFERARGGGGVDRTSGRGGGLRLEEPAPPRRLGNRGWPARGCRRSAHALMLAPPLLSRARRGTGNAMLYPPPRTSPPSPPSRSRCSPTPACTCSRRN